MTGKTARAADQDRTIGLLDVDDVLNAREPAWPGPTATGRAIAFGQSYRLRWAPALTARLAELHKSGLLVLRWSTTWIDHNPDQLARTLGLPILELAFPPDPTRPYADNYRARYRTAKLRAAMAVVRSGDRLIWMDDDAIPTTGRVRDELDAAGALLIAPERRVGLTPDHLDAIDRYTQEEAR